MSEREEVVGSGDARVDSLLERIVEQCAKRQYWNALALGLELQRRLMQLFDEVLKE